MVSKNEIIFTIARARIYISRLFAVVILLLVLFTGQSFPDDSVLDISFELMGLFLLTICSMGRLWALMYISGNKSHEIITDGPYSIVRHPLYLFSLLGAMGIGLVSENLLVLAVIMIFYIIYYPLTILAEEKKMKNKFGQTYLEYKHVTPMFMPKFSLYKGPHFYVVNADAFVKNFISGMWFIWIYILFAIIEKAQYMGFLPVYLKVL
jgi:protein-S-isoprenylcysteine O-methyltransferase Ste14